ncbi:MAG: hypothetical protein ABUS57_04150 [Pseudomonadota bacterium]
MSRSIIAVVSLTALCACATSPGSSAGQTSWGKAGVSLVDYRVDAAQCAVIAAQTNPNENAAGTAGGIGQQNGQPVMGNAVTTGPSSSTVGAGAPSLGGGVYRDSVPSDFVTRAATQQRSQEMDMQRARLQVQRNCLSQRGYREFRLTEEQRAHLATLPEGTDERRAYLYSLGSSAAVLNAQGL